MVGGGGGRGVIVAPKFRAVLLMGMCLVGTGTGLNIFHEVVSWVMSFQFTYSKEMMIWTSSGAFDYWTGSADHIDSCWVRVWAHLV